MHQGFFFIQKNLPHPHAPKSCARHLNYIFNKFYKENTIFFILVLQLEMRLKREHFEQGGDLKIVLWNTQFEIDWAEKVVEFKSWKISLGPRPITKNCYSIFGAKVYLHKFYWFSTF